jgi:RHS repeat-associated protein
VTGLPYSVTDTAGNVTTNTYDGVNQLTQAIQKTSGGTTLHSYSFGFDPAGNMTSKAVDGTSTTFTYNAANELTQASGGINKTYNYDGNGDLTSVSDGTQLTLNAAGQITNITPPGGGPINMTYTGVGETQRVGAGTKTYQYDAAGLSKQTDGSNSTYFTSLPDGTIISESVSGSTYYYLSDGAGSVAGLMDSAGALKNQYSYDPLGNITSSSGTVSNPFTFQGGIFDSQTGFYNTGSGYYDPATGRAFGCQDKGLVDPGEDLCKEDENPSCGGVCSSRGGGQSQQGFVSDFSRGRPANRPNRFRRDWGSPRLCNDLHCTRAERIIIGQYEDRTWDPRAYNPIPTSTGHAFGLGQLTTVTRMKYLGRDYNTTDPLLQLYAMRLYIRDRYGTEDRALAHERIYGWY